ncbi:hypothetical protein [Polaribacter ponticola]|uniref:DUF4296 domain-containing protein n=1 Tax=Polaribacter ponticola TaxID=2978475 RepID=A0ABT5SB00_9FLAO|nr:hypothetical protein [Polaribacter sp. MSW5]MDD7915282.1 hypothetical protein [Polaribacter sp. MSW5]
MFLGVSLFLWNCEKVEYVDETEKQKISVKLKEKTFKELLDYYFEYKKIDGSVQTANAQHQYMADNFVKPIAEAVRKIDNNKYSLEYYMDYGWDGLRTYVIEDYINDNKNEICTE